MSKKFDVVIGNPPYQENDGGKRADGSVSASASPIYPNFVEGASEISDIQSLIIPARWSTGAGKGLSKFSKDMLSSKDIRHFSYFTNAQDIFPNNLIRGGVSFFVKDKSYTGKASVVVVSNDFKETSNRFLDEHSVGVFIPYDHLSNILTKVKGISDVGEDSLQSLVSSRNPYGLPTDFFRDPDKYGLDGVNLEQQSNSDIEIYGLYNRRRVNRFVPKEYQIPKGKNYLNNYKVFLPYASGGNMIGMVDKVQMLGDPILGGPNQIATETYLTIGCFETKYESVALYRYLQSKFLRVMVSILKSTQHATRTFRLVPLQDFTEDSDIDWSVSIPEIDQQLYKKYGLNEEEIDFIESNIKEMT